MRSGLHAVDVGLRARFNQLDNIFTTASGVNHACFPIGDHGACLLEYNFLLKPTSAVNAAWA
jgi:hypothetical protein